MPLTTPCMATGRSFSRLLRHYCYLPLYCFCGNVTLRDCETQARCSSGTVEALRKITFASASALGAGCASLCGRQRIRREEIMAWCEANAVYYCLGLARNKRLSAA